MKPLIKIGVIIILVVSICSVIFYFTIVFDSVPSSPPPEILLTAEYLEQYPQPFPEMGNLTISSVEVSFDSIYIGTSLLAMPKLPFLTGSGFYFRLNGKRRSFNNLLVLWDGKGYYNLDYQSYSGSYIGDLEPGLHLAEFFLESPEGDIFNYSFAFHKP